MYTTVGSLDESVVQADQLGKKL